MPAGTETREGCTTDISGRCKKSEDNGGRRWARGRRRAEGRGRFARLACGPRFPYLSFPDAYVLLGPAWCSLHAIRLPRVESLREPITWCIIHNACYISPATCASPCLLRFSSIAGITFAAAPASFDSLFTARFNNERAHGASEDVGDKFDLAKLQRNDAGASGAHALMYIQSIKSARN